MSDIKDTYFLNSELALEEALKDNKFYINDVIETTQICYYDGEKLPNAPYNCINVPITDMITYFSTTTNRYPSSLNPEKSDTQTPEQIKQLMSLFKQIFKISQQKSNEKTLLLKEQIKKSKPDFSDDKLRVYIYGCRETTVMQYVAKNIANSFPNNDFEVLYYTQDNDLQTCNLLQYLEKMLEFNPHITININHLENDYLNDSIFNFVWFQDTMPILTNEEEINLRERDYIFSYNNLLTDLLQEKKVPENKIFTQDIVPVDTKEFFLNSKIKRENKVIFVGSYYQESDFSKYMTPKIHNALNKSIDSGMVLSEERIINIFEKNNIDIKNDKEYINLILQGYNRNKVVGWLSTIDSKKIEIYGHKWLKSNNTEILNKYKGAISKEKLNDLYNSSKYALSVSGQVINTQRLGEIVHSGAIPLIYDSRKTTKEIKTWENESLYFKTEEELKYIIENDIKPKKYRSKEMLEHFTYKKFINTISEQIRKEMDIN